MAENWTRGLWKAVKAPERSPVYMEVRVGKEHIADIWSDEELASANAHLIAAAPDLYEAVCQAMSYIHAIPVQNQKSFEGIDRVLHLALAKARGEA